MTLAHHPPHLTAQKSLSENGAAEGRREVAEAGPMMEEAAPL